MLGGVCLESLCYGGVLSRDGGRPFNAFPRVWHSSLGASHPSQALHNSGLLGGSLFLLGPIEEGSGGALGLEDLVQSTLLATRVSGVLRDLRTVALH